jgi:hypothetical protein
MTQEEQQIDLTEKRIQCIGLFFEVFHPCWSFVHKGSFDMHQETPLLVQSMLVIGLWIKGGQSAQSAAVELHSKLNRAIQDQKARGHNSIPLHVCFADILIGEVGCLRS